MKSGSKKRPAAPELQDWQTDILARVARSRLAGEVVFGGGAALAAVYLHHRTSEDLDFFLMREIEPVELRALVRGLSRGGVVVDQRVVGPRCSIVLSREGQAFGRVDFAYYPYDPIERRPTWNGLRIESLLDMTVNKVQAVLTRWQPRDLVDLYFLLREGPEKDLERLLDFTRAKFDVGADRFALAERLLMARDMADLPRMVRPVGLEEMVAFFERQARALIEKG